MMPFFIENAFQTHIPVLGGQIVSFFVHEQIMKLPDILVLGGFVIENKLSVEDA